MQTRLNESPAIKGDSYEKIKKKEKIQGDYSACYEQNGIQIGVCEIAGGLKYARQEDALVVAIGQVAHMPNLEEKPLEEAIRSVFTELQKGHGQVKYMGATCCSATAWVTGKKLTVVTANLGDSAATLHIIGKDGSRKDISLTSLHNPNEVKELERLKKFECYDVETKKIMHDEQGNPVMASTYIDPSKNKLNDYGVSRAFGDIDNEGFGLIHDPEIERHTFTLREGESAYVTVGCDGVVENTLVTKEEIGNIIESGVKGGRPVDGIAVDVVSAAYNDAIDDISMHLYSVYKMDHEPTAQDFTEIKAVTAYVIFDKKLYFVDKREKGKCEIVKLDLAEGKLENFIGHLNERYPNKNEGTGCIVEKLEEGSILYFYQMKIVNRPEYKCSMDNISFGIFKVSETPASITVLDGHGGAAVSHDISKGFYSKLGEKLAEYYDIKLAGQGNELKNLLQKAHISSEGKDKIIKKACELILRMDGDGGKDEAKRQISAFLREGKMSTMERLERYNIVLDMRHFANVNKNEKLREVVNGGIDPIRIGLSTSTSRNPGAISGHNLFKRNISSENKNGSPAKIKEEQKKHVSPLSRQRHQKSNKDVSRKSEKQDVNTGLGKNLTGYCDIKPVGLADELKKLLQEACIPISTERKNEIIKQACELILRMDGDEEADKAKKQIDAFLHEEGISMMEKLERFDIKLKMLDFAKESKNEKLREVVNGGMDPIRIGLSSSTSRNPGAISGHNLFKRNISSENKNDSPAKIKEEQKKHVSPLSRQRHQKSNKDVSRKSEKQDVNAGLGKNLTGYCDIKPVGLADELKKLLQEACIPISTERKNEIIKQACELILRMDGDEEADKAKKQIDAFLHEEGISMMEKLERFDIKLKMLDFAKESKNEKLREVVNGGMNINLNRIYSSGVGVVINIDNKVFKLVSVFERTEDKKELRWQKNMSNVYQVLHGYIKGLERDLNNVYIKNLVEQINSILSNKNISEISKDQDIIKLLEEALMKRVRETNKKDPGAKFIAAMLLCYVAKADMRKKYNTSTANQEIEFNIKKFKLAKDIAPSFFDRVEILKCNTKIGKIQETLLADIRKINENSKKEKQPINKSVNQANLPRSTFGKRK